MPSAGLEPAIPAIKRLQTTAIESHDYQDEPASDLQSSDFSIHMFSSRSPRHIDSCLTQIFLFTFKLAIRKNIVYKLMRWLHKVRYDTVYCNDVVGYSSSDVSSGAF